VTVNAYSPWGELAGLTEVTLEWRALAGRLGQYVHRTRTITLDPRMPRRQQRSVLCHELRHATAGDVRTLCDRVNLRQEQRADQDAARLLIHLDDLARALAVHDEHLSAAAVELRVSDAMLRVRLQHLHPSERHYLTRRLTDGCA
jgi:Zn-dependent peptidase ImmA (M78 family)